MIILILMVWVLLKLDAPIWCFFLVGLAVSLKIAEFIVKVMDKKVEKMREEVERQYKVEELSGK